MFKLVSPCIDSLVRKVGQKYSSPCVVSPDLLEQVDGLFRACADLKPTASVVEGVEKTLWLRIPRGTFEDYKSEQFLPPTPRKRWESGKSYGVRREGVSLSEWTTAYPDEYSWYRLQLLEIEDSRQVYLNGKILFNVMSIERDYAGLSNVTAYQLCCLLAVAAADSMKMIRAGTYNDLIASELPYRYRFGIIRADEVDRNADSSSRYIRIVPHYVSSLNGYYMIERTQYGIIGEFMHVDNADIEAFGERIEWDPEEKAGIVT